MFLTGLNFARPQLVACFGLFLTKDLRHRRKSGCHRNKAVLAFSLKASEMWDSLVEEPPVGHGGGCWACFAASFLGII